MFEISFIIFILPNKHSMKANRVMWTRLATVNNMNQQNERQEVRYFEINRSTNQTNFDSNTIRNKAAPGDQ